MSTAYTNLEKLIQDNVENYQQPQQVVKNVDVMIGRELDQVKIEALIRANLNTHSHQQLLHALPDFDNNGFYLFFAVRSNQPFQLKQSLEEFINVGLEILREMAPEEGKHILNQLQYSVGCTGDNVVVAGNLMAINLLAVFGEVFELVTSQLVRGEFRAEFGVAIGSSVQEILAQGFGTLASMKANIFADVTSAAGDKYSLHSLFNKLFISDNTLFDKPDPEAVNQEDTDSSYMDDEDKFFRLLLLIFSSFRFKLKIDDHESLAQADPALHQMINQQIPIEEILQEMKAAYNEMGSGILDQFPFVQSLVDSLSQYASGRITLGIASARSSLEIEVLAEDIGQVYKQIVS
jgi:phosphoglycolate phosphatase-like HAD superfamily hydrolase